MNKVTKLFSVLVLLHSFSLPVFSDTISLAADYWMPFNGDGTKETGYMLDIAKVVFEAKGHNVEYIVTPWARAVLQTRKGTYNAIVGASQGDAPDFIYPEEEQGAGFIEYCVAKGAKWKYSGISSLKGLKLAIINEYSYDSELDEYIADIKPPEFYISYGDTPLENNLNMLLLNRVDAVVEQSAVLRYTINKMKIDDKVEMAGTGGVKSKMYIAFSPSNPKSKEYAKILSDGIVALRKSGELAKILSKYGLKDWK